jgi:4-aminobutyrate aminotransferase-like enzyme
MSMLERLAGRFDFIRNVRGLGLMIGMELGPRAERSAAQLCDEILERCKDAGFLLGKTGPDRNVLTFMPPLIISIEQIEEAVNALEHVLQTL